MFYKQLKSMFYKQLKSMFYKQLKSMLYILKNHFLGFVEIKKGYQPMNDFFAYYEYV